MQWGGPRRLRDAVLARPQKRADLFGHRRDVLLDGADLLVQNVERDDRRDGDEEAHARRDERLGDAAHDVSHDGLVRTLAELVERLDDADDGPEETDERRVVSDRAEEVHAALELFLSAP